MTPSKYIDLKAELALLQKSEAKAQGHLESLLGRLTKDFNCTSIKEAKSLLEEKRASLEKLTKELAEQESAFRVKWEGRLNGD